MISDEPLNSFFCFSLRLGAELEGDSQQPTPPSGGGETGGPSGRALNDLKCRQNMTKYVFLILWELKQKALHHKRMSKVF